MRSWFPTVGQDVGIVAAGVFEGVGKDAEAVEGLFVVDQFSAAFSITSSNVSLSCKPVNASLPMTNIGTPVTPASS